MKPKNFQSLPVFFLRLKPEALDEVKVMFYVQRSNIQR
jgi:hypothetical protein